MDQDFGRTQTVANDNQSSYGGERSVFGGSVAASSVSRRSKQKRSNVQRAGGGGVVVGKVMSRSDRTGKKTKAPPWKEEETAKNSKIVRDSWAVVLEKVGYFELGGLYYDNIFAQQQISHVFTKTREEMGFKFVDMLADVVALCATPNKLHDKVVSLSTMHIAKGVEASMMPAMGTVLTNMLRDCLGKDFNRETKAAWKWLWDFLTLSMQVALDAADEASSVVQSSWDIAMDNFTEEELGGMLYDTLLGIAPNLKQMFHRPRQIMCMKFVEMICTLVSFADDEKTMREQVAWLGARHVKYGAKPHHVPVLNQVILTVMEQAVGEAWTEEMESAWAVLWDNSCTRMMESIRLGEQHGHVVEDIWAKLKAKVHSTNLAEDIGGNVVRFLRKSQPGLISQWTECYGEWEALDMKRRRQVAAEKAGEKRDMALYQVESDDKGAMGGAGKGMTQGMKKKGSKRKALHKLIEFSLRK